MGQVILTTDANYNSYMDSVRALVSPRITDADITNAQIDSIAYLQSIENALIAELSVALCFCCFMLSFSPQLRAFSDRVCVLPAIAIQSRYVSLQLHSDETGKGLY